MTTEGTISSPRPALGAIRRQMGIPTPPPVKIITAPPGRHQVADSNPVGHGTDDPGPEEPPDGDEFVEDYEVENDPTVSTSRRQEPTMVASVRERPPVDDLFRIWTPAELLDADRTFRWQVRGLLVKGSYGQVSGEKKSLKSYFQAFVDIAVASGVSVFGHFAVDEPAPVVSYVGEGGRVPYTRRLERVAQAMGVNLRDIPLFTSFDVAPVSSPRFQETLARDLAERRPGLVSLDPLYAYHGAATNAASLFEEGALLNSLSTPCVDAGASLQVVNHFNKTGSGRGLDRITMAGGQEWSDSWILLSHREAPDVAAGEFRLLLEVGSRQWGGSEWDLDLCVGRFDVDLGEFEGSISWDLHRHASGSDGGDDKAEEKVLAVVAAYPAQLTKTDLVERIGGRMTSARALVDALEGKGVIAAEMVPREGSDGKKRQVWAYRLKLPASNTGTLIDGDSSQWG